MNRLIIIGAGGHGKVIADSALKNGYTEICFVDDSAVGSCMGFPIVGTTRDLERLHDGRTDFVIGIGNNLIRERIAQAHSLNWVTLIHPSADISVQVKVGKGTVIMARAAVNAGAAIGDHCIVNTGAIVEHDDVIRDYAHISPGAKLGGTVTIGERTHVGIGATVRNNTDICEDCVIGAGAVVVRAITQAGTYIGVPARKMV